MTEFSELSDQMIEEFFEGYNYMFARSETKDIYSWGCNKHGQLGQGFNSEKWLNPKKVKFFFQQKHYNYTLR